MAYNFFEPDDQLPMDAGGLSYIEPFAPLMAMSGGIQPTAQQLAQRDAELKKPGVVSVEWDPSVGVFRATAMPTPMEYMPAPTPMTVAAPMPIAAPIPQMPPIPEPPVMKQYSAAGMPQMPPPPMPVEQPRYVDETAWTAATRPPAAPMAAPVATSELSFYEQGLASLTPEQRADVIAGVEAAKNFDLGAYQAQYQKAQADQDAALKAAQATGLSDQYTQLYGGADIIPGMTQGIFSRLGIENPYLPVYTLRGSANKGELSANERMSFAPLPGMEYRLVDKNTGQVTTATTPEEIKALAEAANALGKSGGAMANYAIESGQGGQFSTMYEDRPDISKFDRLAGMALPIAVSLIPGLQGVGAVLANTAAGAAGSAIAGGDPLKGAITGGLTAAGTQFLPKPLTGLGLSADAAKAVGAGIGATTGGVVTGQPLEKALLSGAISGGTTYLGNKLFGGASEGDQLKEWAKEYGAYDLPTGFYEGPAALAEGFNPVNFKAPSLTGGTSFAGSSAPSNFVVTGTGLGPSPSFSVNVPTSVGMTKPEIIATAKTQNATPNLAVNVPYTGPTDIQVQALRDMFEAERQKALAVNIPTQPAMGGPDLEEETVVTAQDEGLRQAEGPGFAVNVPAATPEIIATAQKAAQAQEKEPSLAVNVPAATPETIVTGQRETPATDENRSLAVDPYGLLNPDIVSTAQRETALKDEENPLAVNVGNNFLTDIEVNALKKLADLEEQDSLSVPYTGASAELPENIDVTAIKDKVPVKDEGAVGGTYIPVSTGIPGDEIFVDADKVKSDLDKDNPLSVNVDLGNLLSNVAQPTLDPEEIVVEGREDRVKDEQPAVGGPFVENIVVTGQKGEPKFNENDEYIGPLTNIPSLVDDIAQQEMSGDTTKEKSDLDKLLAALKAAGLILPLLGGGGGGGTSPGKYSSRRNLSPIFSASLPTVGGAGSFTVGGLGGAGGAGGTFGGGMRSPADWYRYAMGRSLDIPAGLDLSRATSPYAGYGPGTLGEETFRRVTGMSHGGAMGYNRGSSRESFAVQGPGTGRSDDIPAVLSDGEYVIDAETVALLGDGSSKAGAKKLDDMRVKIRKHKGKNLAKGKFSVNAKRPEAYMSGGRI